MSFVEHNAIIVTGFMEATAVTAHKMAVEIFGSSVTSIVRSQVNGYFSFMIGPDGSKTSWEEDNEGDDRRKMYIKYLKSFAYSDGSSPVHYVEVLYSKDRSLCKIVNNN